MQQQWLFRFEASDFDATVFDSQQLSAIRGASLTFLYSSELVEKIMRRKGLAGYRKIYGGASQGVYLFMASDAEARATQEEIIAALKRADGDTGCHQHMAYATALVSCGSGMPLVDALRKAEAICAAKSNQNDRTPFPAFSREQTKPGERRDARPAMAGKNTSAAIEDRKAFGRAQRQKFYTRLAGPSADRTKAIPFDFTDDFEEITSGGDRLRTDGSFAPTRGGGELPVSLQNKIGVFFADGNKFGKHREDAIRKQADLSELAKFSERLLTKQKSLLEDITAWLSPHFEDGVSNPWFYVDDDDGKTKARFETLLWGGDELIFVMPAWLAFDFAGLFFDSVAKWDMGVTFSAGLVICDRKTPVRQAKKIAEALTYGSKSLVGGYGENLIQIEIFESLALPTAKISAYREQLYFKGRAGGSAQSLDAQLSIKGSHFRKLIEKIAALKAVDGLPRSQLYKLLQRAATQGAAYDRGFFAREEAGSGVKQTANEDVRSELLKYLQKAGAERKISPENLQILSPVDERAAAFALDISVLAQFWDYVRPFDAANAMGAGS